MLIAISAFEQFFVRFMIHDTFFDCYVMSGPNVSTNIQIENQQSHLQDVHITSIGTTTGFCNNL